MGEGPAYLHKSYDMSENTDYNVCDPSAQGGIQEMEVEYLPDQRKVFSETSQNLSFECLVVFGRTL